MVRSGASCLRVLVMACIVMQVVAIRQMEMEASLGGTRVAAFALGSFWRGEAVFGCLPGVVRTRAGYAGGAKVNPDYHSVGDHAEAVEVEYDPSVISFERLLEVFWASHDLSQVFGQGPDVGAQYRSVIFTQGGEEGEVASRSKEAEQVRLGDRSEVVTEVQPLGVFYPAEAEHQKFELRRKPQLLQLLGEISDEELTSSVLATKLNGYAADLCPENMKKLLDTKVRPFMQPQPSLQQVMSF
ncbi:hypothetical protein M758_11G128900 [Ceratodon purpureus]|nr:hypothetical protein M758_11G128900 [Ceratodon purpureus]